MSFFSGGNTGHNLLNNIKQAGDFVSTTGDEQIHGLKYFRNDIDFRGNVHIHGEDDPTKTSQDALYVYGNIVNSGLDIVRYNSDENLCKDIPVESKSQIESKGLHDNIYVNGPVGAYPPPVDNQSIFNYYPVEKVQVFFEIAEYKTGDFLRTWSGVNLVADYSERKDKVPGSLDPHNWSLGFPHGERDFKEKSNIDGLVIQLKSPQGTVSTVYDHFDEINYERDHTVFKNEAGTGTWRLSIVDQCGDQISGQLKNWFIKIHRRLGHTEVGHNNGTTGINAINIGQFNDNYAESGSIFGRENVSSGYNSFVVGDSNNHEAIARIANTFGRGNWIGATGASTFW